MKAYQAVVILGLIIIALIAAHSLTDSCDSCEGEIERAVMVYMLNEGREKKDSVKWMYEDMKKNKFGVTTRSWGELF